MPISSESRAYQQHLEDIYTLNEHKSNPDNPDNPDTLSDLPSSSSDEDSPNNPSNPSNPSNPKRNDSCARLGHRHRHKGI